ncbi:MAG: hypothetical protein ACKOA1_04040 [Bacteroidota bacterium]
MKLSAMNKTTIRNLFFALLSISPTCSFAQNDNRDLDGKEYIIVKDFKPTLSESRKISDRPTADTSTFNPGVQDYPFISRKAETVYETSSISAVKIKDEPLPKLYRCYLKAGGGNYSKYLGELSLNSLRSKKGAIGLSARHLSGEPSFEGFNNAAYSTNLAKLDGRYFLNNARLDAELGFDQNVVRYYGVPDSEAIISDDTIRQRFTNLSARAGITSTFTDSSKLQYSFSVGYSLLSDAFEASENELRFLAGARKKFGEMLLGTDVDVDVFTKQDAAFQLQSNSSDLDRNILRFNPYLGSRRGKILFKAGVRIESETNEDAKVRFFPQLDLKVPVAEGVLSLFANVDGGIDKNNYHTVSADNPFVNPAVTFRNTKRMIDIRGGLMGNISDDISFSGSLSYVNFQDMQFYISDSVRIYNFDLLYDDVSRYNLHAELNYRPSRKLGVSLRYDQFNYKTDVQKYAWYLPNTLVTLKADYDLREKILVKLAVFGVGSRYYVEMDSTGLQTFGKLKPYVDANLGFEYRYSKILSAFINFNNVGFVKYQQWYGFPMERLNMLGGITYSF